MRILFLIPIALFLIISCNYNKQDVSLPETEQSDSIEAINHSDTLINNNELSATLPSDTLAKPKEKKVIKPMTNDSPIRFIEFPGDANFNGKPMTQQEEIPKNILQKYPDTLFKLALARHKTYDHFFPKSVADNFEEMKSTERIIYPEVLIFRFELFENNNANKPYHIQEVKVKRNAVGEVYTENN